MSYTIDELVEASDKGWLFTCNGYKARVICADRKAKDYPLVCLILTKKL